MMMWPMLLDVVVAFLLVATITYAIRLNRRLGVLREDRQQLQEMIKGLETATRQAEEAVSGLRLGAADAGKALHEVVEKAQGLKADLLFITERANGAADRLEAGLKAQRDATPPLQVQVPPSHAAAAPVAATPEPRLQEQRRRPRIEPDPGAADAKGAQSRLASLLKQAEAAAPAPRPPAPAPVAEPERPTPQSRAERDLLRALEGRR